MKNLIDRLMKDYSDLTFIQYRIKATEMLSETLDNIDERRDRIQADLFYLREEKKQILDTMLSTSSQITKQLYDGI
jgi:hypothetical protein